MECMHMLTVFIIMPLFAFVSENLASLRIEMTSY